jgi:hypothetical protein
LKQCKTIKAEQEYRHSIIPFTTINIQKIRRIEAPDGNYDDNGCGEYDGGNCGVHDDLEYGDNNLDDCTAAAATTAVKNNHESGSSGIYTRGSTIRGPICRH